MPFKNHSSCFSELSLCLHSFVLKQSICLGLLTPWLFQGFQHPHLMGPLSLYKISSERKGSSAIPSVWWVFLSAVSQNVLTSSKVTNGMFKTKAWVALGFTLGSQRVFLVTPKHFCWSNKSVMIWVKFPKEKNYLKLRGRSCSTSSVPLCVPVCWLPSLQQPLLHEQGWRHSTSHSCHLVEVAGEC